MNCFCGKKNYLFWFFILGIFLFIFLKIKHILLPFYIAVFVTVLFGGFVEKCNKKFHIPKTFMSGIITFLFYFFVIYCLYVLFSVSFTKASTSVTNIKTNENIILMTSTFIEETLKKFDIENTFNLLAGRFSDIIAKYVLSIVSHVVDYGTNIINISFLCILAPIATFMMLKDYNLICEKMYFLLPKKIQQEAKILFNEIHNSVFKYIEAQTITAIVLSFCYSSVLFPIGLEHFIILGILIGFSSFVPYIGFYSAATITLVTVYNQFYNIKQVIITLILLITMQIIDCGFITPKIVGNKLGVHPLFIIFGVLASVPIFGFIGIILALPIIGVVSVIIKFLIKKYKNSDYYNN